MLYKIAALGKSERFDSSPMNLCKRDSTANIFLGIFNFFFGQAISQNSPKALIVKGFNLLKISNDYCFLRATQGQLSQCNRKNTILRAVIKSHEGLKGTKKITIGCSVRNLKNFSKFTGKNPRWCPYLL